MKPFPHPYQLTDFTAAIKRELAKRQTAYAKIMKKRVKQWHIQDDDVQLLSIELATEQRIQYELLEDAVSILLDFHKYSIGGIEAIYREQIGRAHV